MHQDIFEPYACSFELSSDDFFPIQKWENALLYFMTILTELTAKEEGAAIGHIKMIAELNETSFIKLNAVRTDLPIEIKRFGDSKGSADVRVSFNSIVYHIPLKRNADIVVFALSRTLNSFSLHKNHMVELFNCHLDQGHNDQHNDGHVH